MEYSRAELVRRSQAGTPLGRIAQGEDVAKVAAFLASDEADYLTGLIAGAALSINVAGGAAMD